MAKIVYPHDLRTELQKIYDSGKLYWHLPGCKLYGEPVLDKRVSHPWPGSPRRFTKTVYDDNVLPWTVQWKKEKDKDVFFGIEITGSCKGMHYIFDRVVVPDVAGAFRYLGKEKELAKFMDYRDAICRITGDGAGKLETRFCHDKSFREWVYALPPSASSIKREAETACVTLEDLIHRFQFLPEEPEHLRDVPLRYVGTKFLEHNLGMARVLYNMVSKDKAETTEDLLEKLWIYRNNKHYVRRQGENGFSGIEMLEAEDIANMFTENVPEKVLFLENKRTLEKHDFGDIVAIGGTGMALVKFVKTNPWLQKVRKVYHWGDIDTGGYRILDSMRKYLPNLQSFLMDTDTLRRLDGVLTRDGWNKKEPCFTRLTGDEMNAYKMLDGSYGKMRIEQKQIPDDIVIEALSKISVGD